MPNTPKKETRKNKEKREKKEKNERKENKETRRARLAAAKLKRNANEVNMFSPEVEVKLIGITNAPNQEVNNSNVFNSPLKGLRTQNNGYSGMLTPEEMVQYYRLHLPTKRLWSLTEKDNLQREGVAYENNLANRETKRSSRSNDWFETGNSYKRFLTRENALNAKLHRLAIRTATRNIKEAIDLERRAKTLRTLLNDDEGADKLLIEADQLRKNAGYVVAEPTEKSLHNAEVARQFAEGIHAKQRRPVKRGFMGTLMSCFGEKCTIAENGTRIGGTRKRRD